MAYIQPLNVWVAKEAHYHYKTRVRFTAYYIVGGIELFTNEKAFHKYLEDLLNVVS